MFESFRKEKRFSFIPQFPLLNQIFQISETLAFIDLSSAVIIKRREYKQNSFAFLFWLVIM